MGQLHKLASPEPRRLRFKLTKFIFCLGLVVALTVFLMGGWMLLVARLQKVVAATWGTVERGCWTEGLYLREEQLLTAPAAGTLMLQVKNGARVPQGEIIALLNRKDGWGQNSDTVSTVERQSYGRYQTLIRQEAVHELDLQRINRDLLNHLKKPSQQKNTADLQALQQEKEQVIRNIQVIKTQAAALSQELEPVLQQWQFITAARPGSFVTECDGWENTLTPQYLEKLTLKDFTRNYPLKSCDRKVKTNEIFGRLINPFNQILAVKIIASQTGIPEVGTVWRFKTVNGWKNATINYVKMFDPQTGVAGVALQAEEAVLTQTRLSKMFVVYKKITGVTVPVQTLFKNDNHTVVRVARGGGYREKAVQILGDDGSKAVISGIEVGTMIISR